MVVKHSDLQSASVSFSKSVLLFFITVSKHALVEHPMNRIYILENKITYVITNWFQLLLDSVADSKNEF